MPGDDGLWLDDHDGRSPNSPHARDSLLVVRQNVVIAEPVLLSAATPDRIRTCLN